MPPARQLRAIWPNLLPWLYIGKPSVVLWLRVEGTSEFNGQCLAVRYCVCRRTSSQTNFTLV